MTLNASSFRASVANQISNDARVITGISDTLASLKLEILTWESEYHPATLQVFSHTDKLIGRLQLLRYRYICPPHNTTVLVSAQYSPVPAFFTRMSRIGEHHSIPSEARHSRLLSCFLKATLSTIRQSNSQSPDFATKSGSRHFNVG